MTGRIYLAGAGPGDPDLLTVKAARLLSQAGAVLYDRLVSPEVLDLVRPGAELHFVGKREGEQEAIQNEILHLLEDCARRHQTVVRLKGGDPMVFGRGAEEWLWLSQRGWPVEVVPGISSSIAVPALAGIPPTYRGISGGFAVVTGHRQEGGCDQWAAYAQVETLIILMAVARRAEIAQCLIAKGRDPNEPVAFIENGTTPRERVIVTTLEQVAAGQSEVANPAVMVAGPVVQLRAELLAVVQSVAA
jgi:uroporphyrin-III C-methyltransferase